MGFVMAFATLTALNTIVSGSEHRINDRAALLGTTDLIIHPDGTTGGKYTTGLLTLQDAAHLASKSHEFSGISPEIHHTALVRSNTNQGDITITGVTPTYLDMMNDTMAQGHFFSWFHVNGQDQVAVLGANVAQSLFGELSHVGQLIYIGNNKFTITGSLQPNPKDLLTSSDNFVLIPVTTAHTLFSRTVPTDGDTPINALSLHLRQSQIRAQAISSIRNVLQLQHKLTTTPDFTIASTRNVIEEQEQPSPSLTRFITALFAVSFIAGGLGMMNMLLVSVTRRNREIAIRKAVGATRWNIFIQFLIESIIVTLLAGVIGLTVGVIGSGVLANASGIATQLTLTSFIQVLLVAAIGGLLFGVYPAIIGATTEPTVPLRNN